MKQERKSFIEYKAIAGTIEDVDFKSRIVTGYWSNFNNKDFDGDVILPGAYKKTIAERGPLGSNEIYFLNQHSWKQPLGKPTHLEERDKGLYHETPVTVTTTYADDALKCMAAGLVVQNSVGFQRVKWANVSPTGNWADDYTEISEIKLYEGSCVTLGANDQTPFTGFKSLSLPEIEDQANKIIKLLRNGDLTDEGFGRLEIALKQLQQTAYNLGQANPLIVNQPDKTTEKDNKPGTSVNEALYNSLTKFII